MKQQQPKIKIINHRGPARSTRDAEATSSVIIDLAQRVAFCAKELISDARTRGGSSNMNVLYTNSELDKIKQVVQLLERVVY